MRSARNQLILLGFICQGLTWDDYFLPLASIVLWLVCLTVAPGKVRFSPMVECLILVAGSLGGLVIGRALGHNTHFFIGHGITLMQAARLLRPLNRREQVFSMLMACLQLGVACTSLFDLRFIPVFVAMAILLPKAFCELESASFGDPVRTSRSPVTWRLSSAIFAISVVFFLAFPRSHLGSAGQLLRTGSADGDSLLDNVLDPTHSGAVQSRRVLLQIQGEQLGYLRCHSLVDFDGVRWRGASGDAFYLIPNAAKRDGARLLARKVRVKQAGSLGGVLPTDGRALGVFGNFFSGVRRTIQGVVECESIWNTGNNAYEYWIDPHPKVEVLSEPLRQRATQCLAPSERVAALLDQIVGGETNSVTLAERLESYLKTNYVYRLGGPRLSRLNPLEDFLFVQKEGHCERFASTLALLLRMKGVPSRVVIGYLPRSHGGMGGWRNVRFNDAHAWTEAYIENLGWITLDATPAASLPETGGMVSDLWDTIDLAWNLHVVNFDRTAQGDLVNFFTQNFYVVAQWLARNGALIGGLSVAALIVGALKRSRKRRPQPGREPAAEQARIVAGHYGQMLRALAAKGFHRQAQQTPVEFLNGLPTSAQPWLGDAQVITDAFCETRYGGRLLPPKVQARVEEALSRILVERVADPPIPTKK